MMIISWFGNFGYTDEPCDDPRLKLAQGTSWEFGAEILPVPWFLKLLFNLFINVEYYI